MMLKTAFCGCCSLRTGSIVLGVLWLLTDGGQVIAYSTDLADETTGHHMGSFIGLCISLLHLLGNVLLLLGADKSKARWVKYAVMNHFVSLVLAAISVVALSVFYNSAILFLAGLIVLAIAGYCWLVIYSFYWQLIEVAMTETQAQLETSALTKPPAEFGTNQGDEEKSLAY
ncbi:lysosomal-associated transmembrane protein 4B-like [Periplaneta americana]|uniref:lysosomal-associated transmembrane protein 4B-like n=1 Tax=Periplaneta americana TaxID=6978 RepID=UPI0037E8455A